MPEPVRGFNQGVVPVSERCTGPRNQQQQILLIKQTTNTRLLIKLVFAQLEICLTRLYMLIESTLATQKHGVRFGQTPTEKAH